jgi:hypothetical protein
MRLRVSNSEPRRDAIANGRYAVRLRDAGMTYDEIGCALNRSAPSVFTLVRR